ncbi:HNH endonuclease [Prosthecobacter fusiformis]|uniref:HNH endonuclease n=1 Tax=Prosthecobacter fusiformis TaxID=48464 RepID=A0A4V6Q5B3_9BACT|nr:HNH endonuclease [Prosthecobacter fusiformis]
MEARLRKMVRERARERCEYCNLSQDDSALSFHIEHIIPKQHGGQTALENLALACPNCNLHKGPNLTGYDPDTGKICTLFHPRQHEWGDHFERYQGRISGTTAMGRTTVWLLEMNREEQQNLRLD